MKQKFLGAPLVSALVALAMASCSSGDPTFTSKDEAQEPESTGAARIELPHQPNIDAAGGLAIEKGRSRRCDLVKDIDAAPERQVGASAVSSVKLELKKRVKATSVVWSTATITGGSGTIGSLSGTTDLEVTFDCSTNGNVSVIAQVTGVEAGSSCTEQARVTIKCVQQGTTTPACGDGVVQGSEQCDGTAGVGSCPAGTTGTVTCSPQCTRNTSACAAPAALCGDGIVNGSEQCDGTAGLGSCPAGAPGTVTCTNQCMRSTASCTAAPLNCGNGTIEGSEQCDGTAGLGSCPAGTTGTVTCTPQCTRNTSGCVAGPLPIEACGLCAADNCALERAAVDANLTAVDPIVSCVLGDDWQAGNRAPATSCANTDLVTCYCGGLSGRDCVNAAPSALDGQCVPEILAGTGCTTSSCVAPIFLDPTNATGTAMQYIQCQQDFCYDTCFSSDSSCGNGIVEGSERCDGSAGLGSCPAGTTGSVSCNADCTRNTSACVPTISCGNGILEGSEQCDGAAGVGSCPAGTIGTVTCTNQCTRNTSGCLADPPPPSGCGTCAADFCALQRAAVDANLTAVDPIMSCVLGDDWEAGNRAPATSCANLDLLTCYCGALAGQDCANAAPSALDGQCVSEILAGMGCTTSSCVAPIFLDPANPTGTAMQYIQCQQDFCYDACFNPAIVCGNGLVEDSEQCDGSAGVGSCPLGTTGTVTCTQQCTRNTSACVPTSCGDGVVNGSEQCDGTAGVGSCPAGTTGTVTCNPQCTRNTSACVADPLPINACGLCAAENCTLQRADLDANLTAADPIISCVLGDDWEEGERAAATSCGNWDLLICYCGTSSGQDCANAAPSALNGQCVPEVLAGTGCTTSSCVAPVFLNPANANGKAMQYIQCQQDFCYDACFNP